MRLNEENLASLKPGITRFAYDRSKIVPGIVHLGIGAFHRAHEALYTDAALAAGDKEWGIIGAGLVSATMSEALTPQNGLYAMAISDPAGERYQVVGSVLKVLSGVGSKEPLVAAMAAPSTRIVSVTVTEKGYHLHSATRELNFDSPGIASDLADPAHPQTVPGLIVEALRRRRAAGLAPFTVLSCDNLPGNGEVVRRAVTAFACKVDADLGAWIEVNVAFPSTMVDRITPATTDEDKARVATAIGLDDAAPVVTEPFSQWVVEDNFPLGRPRWELGGAIFSNEIEAWEQMKLRCLNGAHSTLSYMGQLLGLETVAEAMGSSRVASLVQNLWKEIIPTLKAPSGSDPYEYVKALDARFRNPAIRHRTAQIAMDGSQKLPQRLLAPLRKRIEAGQASPHIETAVAAWMLYVSKTIRQGGTSALKDPLAEAIAAKVAEAGADPKALVSSLLSLSAIFDTDLPANTTLRGHLEARVAEFAAEFGL